MISTLRAITSSIGRLGISSTLDANQASITALVSNKKFLEKNEVQSVNVQVPSRGVRRHFKGFRRNWPEFPHYMREKRHYEADAWKWPKTRAASRFGKFNGHIDIYGKEDGKRQPLEAAVLRFKRLDGIGTYINGVPGRTNKAFQKTHFKKMQQEQHNFTFHEFYAKLDRMMTSEQKERRYFPDDPYEKYNKMSYLKQKYSLEKNKKLIEEHGNKVYKYDRYKAHRDYLSHYNDLPKEQYMPPGYLKTVADTGGPFLPEGDNVYHEPEWMAPHCQRTPITEPEFITKKKNFKKIDYHLDKNMEMLRNYEIFYKRLKPWSRLMHRTRY